MNLGFSLLKKYIGGEIVYSSLQSSHNGEKAKKKITSKQLCTSSTHCVSHFSILEEMAEERPEHFLHHLMIIIKVWVPLYP